MRVYLNVPFDQNGKAKSMGCWFDPDKKKWYINDPQNLEDFASWLPIEEKAFFSGHRCAEMGCHELGSISHATDGSGQWLCSRHFFRRHETGEITPEQRKENLEDMSRLFRNVARP